MVHSTIIVNETVILWWASTEGNYIVNHRFYVSNWAKLNQVWSIACIGAAPPRLVTPQAKRSKTLLLLPPMGMYVQFCIKGGNSLHRCWDNHSLACSGASILIIIFVYFAKHVTCEINRHHYRASKLASICVPWASELFGKVSDFSYIEFQLKCC